MNLLIRVAEEPICQLLRCPKELAESVRKDFNHVEEYEDDLTTQSPFSFIFGEMPTGEPSQALAGVIHKVQGLYLGFDRNGAPFELPFGNKVKEPARHLRVSPAISS